MPKTFQDFVADAKTRIKEIDHQTLKLWLDEDKEFTLVDVREESEYGYAHIANANNVPRGVLELKIADIQPDADALIVLYCGGGNRSALTADVLQQMGYANVVSLAGGWRTWAPLYESGNLDVSKGSACQLPKA